MRFSDLERPSVAILGAGREGRAAWRELRRRFPDKPLTIFTETEPAAEFAGDFRGACDSLVEGPFDGAALARHRVLIRSPGVSPYRTALVRAREAGAVFSSATSLWFAEHPEARTICITGTKGKSTTSALSAHLLRRAGCSVRLAGNIGHPLLDCPDQDVDWWVIELSSYQLVDLEARPTIAAILNLSDAHLEWHGGRRAYHRDKLRIVRLARGAGLVANYRDAALREALCEVEGVRWFGHGDGLDVRGGEVRDAGSALDVPRSPALPGEHNLLNLCAALTLVDLAGVARPDLRTAVESFRGLPHRLERLGTRSGIEYVDDSMATTPVATLAALQALEGSAVTLILGGTVSDVDWSGALEKMHRFRPHAIIAIPDSGPALASVLRAGGLEPPAGILEAVSLEEAMRMAGEVTPAGGTILLSPGAPSFPRFRDFAERGRRFARLAGFDAGRGDGAAGEDGEAAASN